MDVTLYPDEDWTVDSVHSSDVSAITLTAPGEGQSVRIEAAYSVLAEIGRRWANEVSVTANGRNPDAVVSAPYKTRTLDAIDQKIENLETILSDYRAEKGEEGRYPQDFRKGDWVRFPPQHTWRKISRVREGTGVLYAERVVFYEFGGKEYGQTVRNQTRYPYMQAKAMEAVAKEEAQ
jgi:hypothetical protein